MNKVGVGISPTILEIPQTFIPIADWFWNPITGNDSNTGKSPTQPFLTWTKVRQNWLAGETLAVGIGAGIIRSEVMMPGNNSKIIPYGIDMGSGQTTFDASDILEKINITKTVGQTFVYQFTVTLPNVPSEPAFPQLWGNDTYFTRQTSIANVNANANTCYWTGTTGSVTCYFRTPDGSDPIVNETVYTYSARLTGLYGAPTHAYGSVTGCQVSGIQTQKNLAEGGSLKMGNDFTFTNVSCRYGSKHNALVGEGGTWTGGTVEDAYYNASATLIVINTNTPTGKTVSFSGLNLRLTAATPVSAKLMIGPMNSHYNISGSFGTITVADCTFTGFMSAGGTFGFNHTPAIVLTNPIFINCQYGISGPYAPETTFTVTGGTWTTNLAADIRAVNWNSGMAKLIMTDFTFNLAQGTTCYVGMAYLVGTNNVSITNCHFVGNATSGLRVGIYVASGASGTYNFSNNTFNTGSGSGWSYHYYFHTNSAGMTWISDNNAFEATNDTWYITGVTYNTFATYQTAVSPKDTNSISV